MTNNDKLIFLERQFVVSIFNKNCLLACGFPKTFALKDFEGQYYCIHQSTVKKEKDCPENFANSNLHAFYSLSHDDDSLIPSNKCILRPHNSNDELMVSGDGELKVATSNDVSNKDRHFLAADVGSNHVIIFNYKQNKYLRSDGAGTNILLATEAGDCGSDCHFILENVNIPSRRRKRGNLIIRF